MVFVFRSPAWFASVTPFELRGALVNTIHVLQANTALQTAWSAKEVFVVRDLIAHFEAIWEPTEVEKRREVAIRRVLMRVMSNTAPTAPKAAGDLRAWLYVHDRSTCYQVAVR